MGMWHASQRSILSKGLYLYETTLREDDQGDAYATHGCGTSTDPTRMVSGCIGKLHVSLISGTVGDGGGELSEATHPHACAPPFS